MRKLTSENMNNTIRCKLPKHERIIKTNNKTTMNKTLLVSLVSDQTIPNFLSIKTFTEADYYLFITTDLMENDERGNRRKWIMKAAGIDEQKSFKKTVDAESKEDVIEKLNEFNWDQFSDIIVNITGGTKMMSLACYEFFKTKTENIWYLPIRSNEYHLCDKTLVKRIVTYNSNVEEYLKCCGIHQDENRFSEKVPIIDTEYTFDFFNKFTSGKIDYSVLEKIRILFRADEAFFKKQMERKKMISLNDFEDFKFISEFLKSIQFPSKNEGILYKNEMEYLTGGWFEEFSYYLLRKNSHNPENQFKLGVVMNPSPRDKEKAKYFTNNDLDVVLVNDNMLYVIECKSGGMDDRELFNKTVYLASALKKYFGLTVKSALFTLSVMTDNQKEKAETLGIMALDRSVFISQDRDSVIKTALNI